jgi:hypothetical protein
VLASVVPQGGKVHGVVPLDCARAEQTTISGASYAFLVWCPFEYFTFEASSAAGREQWVSATKSTIQQLNAAAST